MKFEQLHSSSSGNAYVVTAANGKRLLIECGVAWPLLQKALDYDLSGIEGCLLSHEHKDHSKAVKDVMKAGINVYSSRGTFEACGVLGDRRAVMVSEKMNYYIGTSRAGGFYVAPYNINHDALEPFMYIVGGDGEHLLFATDTPFIKQKFKVPFDIIAIECSYNEPYLRKRVDEGTIDKELAKRLLKSHMEESTCLSYLQNCCDLSKCHSIHLLHMSHDNINLDRIKKEFKAKLFIEVITVGD